MKMRLALVCSFAAFLTAGCLDKAPAPGEIPSSLSYKGAPVDPACLMAPPDASSAKPMPLDACTGRYKAHALYRPDHFYGYEIMSGGPAGPEPASAYYKYLGQKDGQDLIQVAYADGSGAEFSDVRSLKVSRGGLQTLSAYAVGDRCAGGVVEAGVANGQISWSTKITPYGMIELSGGNKTARFKPYADIQNCPECCVGVAHYTDGRLTQLELTLDPKALPQVQDLKNSCFYTVYADAVARLGATLDESGIADFGTTFERQCGPG